MPAFKKFDVADYLTDDETITAYLLDAIEEGDTRGLLKAISVVARVKGMPDLWQSISEMTKPPAELSHKGTRRQGLVAARAMIDAKKTYHRDTMTGDVLDELRSGIEILIAAEPLSELKEQQ